MPKVTEAHLEAQRQQVLDPAFACFARQGFHQTTMDDICRETGLSAGALQRYFQSKEKIIEAVCEGYRQANTLLIEAATERGSTLEILDGLAKGAFTELDQPESNVWLQLNIQL